MFARLMKPSQVFEYSQNNTEIKAYLKEPRISYEQNKNILLWWKANKSVYPVISLIIRDYLALMPASVYSEKSFSTGGQLISKERNSFHPETARELMCVRSWMNMEDLTRNNEEQEN